VDPRAAGNAPLASPTRLNTSALLSLLSSISGFLCLWGVGGLLGIVLGLVARSELDRSSDREHGRGLATAGLVLGVVNVGACVIGLAVFATWVAGSKPPAPPAGLPPPPMLGLPPPASAVPPGAARAAGEATRERDTRATDLGGVTVVDPGLGDSGLLALIAAERDAAKARDQKLVLFTVSPECAPCLGVAASLRDRRMQGALDGVRLLRLDVREFAPELERLGVPIETIPGFVLLGPDLRPRDFVDGGEWDEDVPANIAPVLGPFVRGTYAKRRRPWRATLRDGETAL
jgi:hypothetical protein